MEACAARLQTSASTRSRTRSPTPIRFDEDDVHASLRRDMPTASGACWFRPTACSQQFPHRFLGKSSPVHFFWGSFDLAVTRFSGRRAPPHPGGVPNLPDAVTREAYSHEVSSAGSGRAAAPIDYAAFYSYAYPAPEGSADAGAPARRIFTRTRRIPSAL